MLTAKMLLGERLGNLRPSCDEPVSRRPCAPLRVRAELHDPSLFLNRELTWLAFNHRVLNEAADNRTPLLERVKFLSIFGSNLDEFHMKRVGGLKHRVGADVRDLSVDGRTPRQQIEDVYGTVRAMSTEAEACRAKLLRALRARGIRVVSHRALRKADQAWLRQYYLDNVFPLITPQSIDPAHPFPFVSNLSLNLLVSVRAQPDGPTIMSRVKLPLGGGVPRFVRVRDEQTFVMLEELVEHNLALLFPDTQIDGCALFRVTRNAIADKARERADDLRAMIESELLERKFAPVVRLEVSVGMRRAQREKLAQALELSDPSDVFEVDGMQGLRDLMELWQLPLPRLHERPHHPVDHPMLPAATSLFHSVRDARALILHHPYHSFGSSVERLLHEASTDPRVRAVKMTLYRTSAETTIVDHLIEAARNGKQVAVVVELKARFDEEANIRAAHRLESAGIHVTYGIVGLKTHAKIILVVREDPGGLKRYVHVGTGNYHAGTAKLYTDLGLLTCDDDIGRDVSELFNYLTTGVSAHRHFSKLLLGPRMMKLALIVKIEREAQHAIRGAEALIRMKMNALEDPEIVRALYRASQVGVTIELIVRDTCRLRPGVPGLSERIRVVSVVGRFLEHARLFFFRNGGEEELFIGSADLMTRNLDSRVEVLVPIELPKLREELNRFFAIQLHDQRAAWDMRHDGSYVQRKPSGPGDRSSCQEQLIQQLGRRQRSSASRKDVAKIRHIRARRVRGDRDLRDALSARPSARSCTSCPE